MRFPIQITVLAALAVSFVFAPGGARADEPEFAAAGDDRPAGMDAQTWADLQVSATLDRDDLYEDEAVTREEFAAQVAALDAEMLETIRAKAAIVYEGEE